MATKMVEMGVSPAQVEKSMMPEKTSKNEKDYPTLMLSGSQAEKFGAESFKEGDVIRQTVEWRVKRHSKVTEGGKTRFSIDLCLERASVPEEVESTEEDDGEEAEEPSAEKSPAMDYISRMAAKG